MTLSVPAQDPPGPAKAVGSRSARRRAREFAVQALYQWQLAGTAVEEIEKQLAEAPGYAKLDQPYFQRLLRGTIANAQALEEILRPHLDRPARELSPVEHGILLLAAFELVHQPEVPYRVVINEAVELAKMYGGTDGHKYVNGVLDKVAAVVRAAEARGKRTQD